MERSSISDSLKTTAGTVDVAWVCMQEAKEIGDEFLALEKYVNLNYLVSIANPKNFICILCTRCMPSLPPNILRACQRCPATPN